MADNSTTTNVENLDKLFTAVDTIIQKRIENLPYDKTIIATIKDASKAAEGCYTVDDGTTTFLAYSDNVDYRENQQVYINIPQGDFTKQRVIIGKYFPNDDNKFIYNYISPMDSFVNITRNLISTPRENSNWLIANGKTKYKCLWQGEVSLVEYDTLGVSAEFRSWLNNYNDLISGEYGIQIDIVSQKATSETEGQPLYYTFYFTSKEMLGDPYNYDTFYLQEKTFDISGIKQIDAIRIGFFQNSDFRSRNSGYLIAQEEDIQYANLFINNPIIAIGYNANRFKEDTILLSTNDSEMYFTELTDVVKNNNPNTDLNTINTKHIDARWIHLLTEEEQSGIYNLTSSGVSATRILTIADFKDYEQPFSIKWYRNVYDENVDFSGFQWDANAGEYWYELVNNQDNFSVSVIPDPKRAEEQYKAIIEYPSMESVLSSVEEYFDQDNGLYDQREALIDTPITIKNNNNEEISYISLLNIIENTNSRHIEEMRIQNQIYFVEIQYQLKLYTIAQDETLSEEQKGLMISEANTQYQLEHDQLVSALSNLIETPSVTLNSTVNQDIYNDFLNLLNLDVNSLLKEISFQINLLKEIIKDDQQFQTEASNYLRKLEFKNQLRFLKVCFPKYIGQYDTYIDLGYTTDYESQIVLFFSKFRSDFNNEKIRTNICFSANNEADVNEKNALLFIYDIILQLNYIDDEMENYRNSEIGKIQYCSSSPMIFKNTDPTASLNAIKDALSNLEIVVDENGYQGTYNLYEEDGHIQNEDDANQLRTLEAKYEKYSSDSNPVDNNEIITWRIPLFNTMIQHPEEGVEYQLYDKCTKTIYQTINGVTSVQSQGEVTTDNYKSSLYYYYDEDNNKYINITASSEIAYSAVGQFYKRNSTKITEENGYIIISRQGVATQNFRIKSFCEASFTNNEIFCTVKKDLINLEASTSLSFSPVGNSGTNYTFFLEFYDNQNQFALQATSFSQDDVDKNKHKLKVRARLFNELHEEVTNENSFSWSLMGGYFDDQNHQIIGAQLGSSNGANNTIFASTPKNTTWDTNTIKSFSNLIIKCQCKTAIALGGNNNDIMEMDDEGYITNTNYTQQEKRDITLTAYLSIPVIKNKQSIGGYVGSGLISYSNAGTDPYYYNGVFKVYNTNLQLRTDGSWIMYGPNIGEENYFPKITSTGSLSVPSIYLQETKQISIQYKINNIVEFILPLRIYKRVYALKVINSWDGSLTLNENDGIILSTMMGAGKKDDQNRFNGVLIGDMADEDEGNIYYTGTGLYGFNEGVKSFGFNINGVGFIGKASTAQILFNGNEGTITSASFGSADGGIYIDLNDGWMEVDGKGDNSANILINANLDNSDAYFKIASPTKDLIFIGNDNYFLQSNNFNGSEGSLVNATQGCHLDLEDGTLIAVDAYLKGKIETTTLTNWGVEYVIEYHRDTRRIDKKFNKLSTAQQSAENLAMDTYLRDTPNHTIYRDDEAEHKSNIKLEEDSISIHSQYISTNSDPNIRNAINSLNSTFTIEPMFSQYDIHSGWSNLTNIGAVQGRQTTTKAIQQLVFSSSGNESFKFDAPVYINGDFYVAASWDPQGITYRNISLQGDVNIYNNLNVGNQLYVDDNLNVGNQLYVEMKAEFNDDVMMYWLKEDSSGSPVYIGGGGRLRIHVANGSSREYKTDIKILNNENIQNLYNIPIYTFKYKEGHLSKDNDKNNKILPGFITEDLEQIIPEAVKKTTLRDNSIRYMWDYEVIVPLMFQMIKNNHEEIQQLQKENQKLKEKIYENK